MLKRSSEHPGPPKADERHEPFIDDLIRQNRVLLGGDWSETAGPFGAAYLLYCESLEEARAVVNRDPLVQVGVYEPTLIEWHLVGINPEAIDNDLVLTAEDC